RVPKQTCGNCQPMACKQQVVFFKKTTTYPRKITYFPLIRWKFRADICCLWHQKLTINNTNTYHLFGVTTNYISSITKGATCGRPSNQAIQNA
ncbi:MAG: hypothetical protein IJD47_06065, partial [Clostridia bacterium]|nr:hypothetical protein [Clostridia bacterium]